MGRVAIFSSLGFFAIIFGEEGKALSIGSFFSKSLILFNAGADVSASGFAENEVMVSLLAAFALCFGRDEFFAPFPANTSVGVSLFRVSTVFSST